MNTQPFEKCEGALESARRMLLNEPSHAPNGSGPVDPKYVEGDKGGVSS